MNYITVICFIVAVIVCLIVILHDPIVDRQREQHNQDIEDNATKNNILNTPTCEELWGFIVPESGHWFHADKFYKYESQRWLELKCNKKYGVEP